MDSVPENRQRRGLNPLLLFDRLDRRVERKEATLPHKTWSGKSIFVGGLRAATTTEEYEA